MDKYVRQFEAIANDLRADLLEIASGSFDLVKIAQGKHPKAKKLAETIETIERLRYNLMPAQPAE